MKLDKSKVNTVLLVDLLQRPTSRSGGFAGRLVIEVEIK